MKQQYKRSEIYYYINWKGESVQYGDNDHYVHRYTRCHSPRTHLNRKRLSAYPEFTRAKQRRLPSSWDDWALSYNWGKCWKRFTKKRKQYL